MPTKIQKNQIATTLIDGWTPADATWTYASASTITVPSGAASIYQKGDRIKWTQTTVKYGVIVAVADTLLTIAVNTDYTVANAAITLNYYSHQANPLGYPGSFAFAISCTGITSGFGGAASFAVIGNVCTCNYYITSDQTSNATTKVLTLPINSALNITVGPLGGGKDNGSELTTACYGTLSAASANMSMYKGFNGTAWTASGNCTFRIGTFSYMI